MLFPAKQLGVLALFGAALAFVAPAHAQVNVGGRVTTTRTNTFTQGAGSNLRIGPGVILNRYGTARGSLYGNPYAPLLSSSSYGYSPGGQGYGGTSNRSPGNGGYGSQSQPTSTPSEPSGSGDRYNPSSPSSAASASSPRSPGKDQLTTLRRYGGGLDWPVALRYLTRDDDWQELRERIDFQVERLLAKPTGQPISEDFIQGLSGDVDKLRKHLQRQSYDIPTTRQQETDARRFLGKLSFALEQFPKAAAASTSR